MRLIVRQSRGMKEMSALTALILNVEVTAFQTQQSRP
jgi:hypothetical protein